MLRGGQALPWLFFCLHCPFIKTPRSDATEGRQTLASCSNGQIAEIAVYFDFVIPCFVRYFRALTFPLLGSWTVVPAGDRLVFSASFAFLACSLNYPD
jgi:hypothetical protein